MKKILFIIIIIFMSCSLFQTKRAGITGYLPRETHVPGWQKLKGPVVHKKTDNPAIEEEATIVFRSFLNKEVSLTVQVIQTPSLLDAFMYFSLERRKATARKFTVTSFYSDRGYFFYKGRYYAAVIGDNRDDRLLGEIKQFKEAMESIFSDYTHSEKLPAYINLFAGDTADYSLLYKKYCLAITSEQLPFFSRYYLIGDTKYEVFFSPYGNNKSQKFFNSLLKDASRDYTFSQGGDFQICFRKYKEKFLFVSQYKKWIFGVLDAENISTGKKIVQQLHRKLKDFKE